MTGASWKHSFFRQLWLRRKTLGTVLPPEPSSFAPSTPQSAPAYRDRSTGLQAYGVIQIILGALVSLFIPLVLLAALMSRNLTGTAMPIGNYFTSCLTYAAFAVLLITLGVGSLRARRWARALTLILSWFTLVIGFLATVLMTAVLPTAFAAAVRTAAARNPGNANLPTGVTAVVLTVMIVLFAVFLVVIPLAFVLFYGRADVEQTCRHRDPVDRWTDRCPLPVLAASLLFAVAAFYYLLQSFTTPLVPFFGKYLTGVPGAAACLVLAAIDALLALWFFRVQILGWRIGVLWVALRTISTAVTDRRGNLLQAYQGLGWKQAQIDLIARNPMLRGHVILWWNLVYLLVGLGYLIWIKRYFPAPASYGGEPAIPQPVSSPDPGQSV
jgi:hypothetical protein